MTRLVVMLGLVAAGAYGDERPETFSQYCYGCHSDAVANAGINLERLTSESSVADSFKQWQRVAAALEQHAMPPPGAPTPAERERREAARWIRESLADYAAKHGGDPGRVTVRRLTSAEYAYTIRDLTGVDLDLGHHFAGDAVGGEGFSSFGDVQFMADANLESYLEVAKLVAEHAVIGSGPLQFGVHPRQSGYELSAIHRIHDLYRQHGFRATAAEGARPFGLDKYGAAFYAAWAYRHREGDATLEEFALREGLSLAFVKHVWSVLNREEAPYPVSEAIAMWRALPAAGDENAIRAKCTEIQNFVVDWPRWLFAVGAMAQGGGGDEGALIITDETVVGRSRAPLKFTPRDRGDGLGDLYLSVTQLNPGMSSAPRVVWRNATVQATTHDQRVLPERPLLELLPATEIERIGFGRTDGLGPGDFATVGEARLRVSVPAPEEWEQFTFRVEVEVDLTPGDDSILRVVIGDLEDGSRTRAATALLTRPESAPFARFKSGVLEHVANFPQASHGEPTPADRDPIPAPFDNTYDEPERDLFHFRIKYYRQDDFLVDKMLDDQTKVLLDQAWFDLLDSFDYHDEFFVFTANKFGLALDKRLSELDAGEIAALPDEPRAYAEALRSEFDDVQAAQLAAQPGHIDDVLAFAARAWRRPLAPGEADLLRRLYNVAREDRSLDHRSAIRTMLTKVLVAPEFLYRLERPELDSGPSQLSPWELASRMSYFLWASAPDEELRHAAASGALEDESEIAKQVRRMLSDPKARRLATEFFGQWLGFYRFDQHTGVDAKRFPEFNEAVKSAMYDEAVSFFEHIIRERRPLREVFSADYTFLNDALARHYGAEVEAGREMGLIETADRFKRGGMMRLGAILTATSAPLRTSPVKRGDWILRRVLGTPTPPPPPDAGSLPGDEKSFGAMTVREQLEAHRANTACASCHSRIDPLGFALEHYDAVGRWREAYDNGKPVDAASVMAGGTPITGVESMLDYIESQERQILLNLSEKLLGYAFGRTIIASDLPLLDRMVAAGFDATFEELALQVATSRQFRYRRGRNDETPIELADGGTR